MKNRIWNEAFCLMGLTAAGSVIAQDGLWTSSYSGSAPSADERYHRGTWTSDVYGHSGAQTTGIPAASASRALTTQNYRYESVPGATNQYQYTWASSYDPTVVATVAQAQTTSPATVQYQWPDGSKTSESLASSSVTTKTTTTTTTFGEGGYRYSSGANVVTNSARIVEESYTEPVTTYRRNFLRRHVWDAYSSRFSVKAAFSFNVKTDFTSANPNNIGSPDGGDVLRTYSDGFVAGDSGAAASAVPNSTWFFGYNSAAQIPGGIGPVVILNSVDSPTDGTKREDRENLPGVEVAYEEILGQFQVAGGRRWNFGVFGGFGFSRLNSRDAGATAGTVGITQDRYESRPLVGTGPGVVPVPGAPVSGRTSTGGGSLIYDEPTPVGGLAADAPGVTGAERTFTTHASTGSIVNRLNGNLFGFQMGPFIEAPITDRLLVVLGGGFGMVLADLDYSFAESWSLTAPLPANIGPGTYTRNGQKSSLDFLWGGYARLNIRYEFDDHWAAEIGGMYQHLGSERNSVNGKTANLNMKNVFSVNGGVSYSF